VVFVFDDALRHLSELPLDMKNVSVQRGCSDLTPTVQSAFHGFIDRLLADVTNFNRTSCALSNFPDEHHIPKAYEQALLRDIAAAWREFSVSANGILLDKMP
jgi:monoamine oxidase